MHCVVLKSECNVKCPNFVNFIVLGGSNSPVQVGQGPQPRGATGVSNCHFKVRILLLRIMIFYYFVLR